MKVHIMRGIPGAGKSTFVRRNFPAAIVCSADNHFTDQSGNYRFDPRDLGVAHAKCARKFADTLRHMSVPDVVVDNTGIELWEISPYVLFSEAFGAEFEIVTILCDPKVAAERNVHGVPQSTIENMDRRIRTVSLKPWWPHRIFDLDSE